ncbi:hypothetical protein HY772_07460 [Candidatus Woesearchaeota archaeon]|nr:hypothetical protein [Candidatus Woesearchaeota archaeon]
MIIPATHDIPEGDPCHSSTRGRIPKGMPSVAGRIIHKKHDCTTQITTEDGERRGDAAM